MKYMKVIKAKCSSQHLGCNKQKANGLGVDAHPAVAMLCRTTQKKHPSAHKCSLTLQLVSVPSGAHFVKD